MYRQNVHEASLTKYLTQACVPLNRLCGPISWLHDANIQLPFLISKNY